MQETAKLADRLTIVRSMTHTEVDHSRGEHSMFTGYRPSPALVYPSVGSVVAHELGPNSDAAVRLRADAGEPVPEQRLSEQCLRPVCIGGRPGASGFPVRDLIFPKASSDRFETRSRGRSSSTRISDERDDSIATMDSFYQRAYELLASASPRCLQPER